MTYANERRRAARQIVGIAIETKLKALIYFQEEDAPSHEIPLMTYLGLYPLPCKIDCAS